MPAGAIVRRHLVAELETGAGSSTAVAPVSRSITASHTPLPPIWGAGRPLPPPQEGAEPTQGVMARPPAPRVTAPQPTVALPSLPRVTEAAKTVRGVARRPPPGIATVERKRETREPANTARTATIVAGGVTPLEPRPLQLAGALSPAWKGVNPTSGAAPVSYPRYFVLALVVIKFSSCCGGRARARAEVRP